MELITLIIALTTDIRAGDWNAVKVDAGKLLVLIGNVLTGSPKMALPGEQVKQLTAARADLSEAIAGIDEEAPDHKAVGANGQWLKAILALIEKLLPLIIG